MRGGALPSSRRHISGAYPTIAAPLHVAYDASQQTVTNGATVTTFTDYSGNSRTATKGGSGTVTYATAGLNGKPAFTFPGLSWFDTTTFTSISGTTPVTIAAVVLFTTTTSGTLLATTGGAGSLSAATSQWAFERGGAQAKAGAVDASAHRIQAYMDGASASRISIDGVATVGPSAIGGAAFTEWRLGADGSGNGAFVGKLAELRIFTGTLSGSESSGLDAYFVAKWGF